MMNPLRELKLNQPGRIESVEGATLQGYDGLVREITDRGILLQLRDSDVAPNFHVGQRVTFKYWDVFGLHRGETEVTHVSDGRPNELEVAPPDRIELMQKRRFFRVNVTVPVTLRSDRPDHIETVTHDLTPVGMRARTDVPFAIGEDVMVRLDFAAVSAGDGTPPVETMARVVRLAIEGDCVNVCFEFPRIPDAEQVRISLLLFQLQRRVTQ